MFGKFLKEISVGFFLVVLPAFLLSAQVSAQDKISIFTEDSPPLNYVENNMIKGPSAEIVQKIIEKLKPTNEEIKVYPWARAYKMAEKSPNIALFSATKTDARDKIFKWVGPLAIKQRMFFSKKGSAIKINRVEDAKQYKVGVLREGSSDQFLRKNEFPNVDAMTSEEVNLKKLLSGRIDIWYTSKSTATAIAKKIGIDLKEFHDIFTVKKSTLYIAFNNKTSDKVIKEWQDAYDALKEDGTIDKIFKKYDLEFMNPNV